MGENLTSRIALPAPRLKGDTSLEEKEEEKIYE